ncbi:MAG: hypothetical protein ACO3EZ_14450 [Prochlorotrichaceae cyanobacterium]
MKASTIVKFAAVAVLLLMFRNTIGSVITFAAQLDRVTAEKVSQLESLGN